MSGGLLLVHSPMAMVGLPVCVPILITVCEAHTWGSAHPWPVGWTLSWAQTGAPVAKVSSPGSAWGPCHAPQSPRHPRPTCASLVRRPHGPGQERGTRTGAAGGFLSRAVVSHQSARRAAAGRAGLAGGKIQPCSPAAPGNSSRGSPPPLRVRARAWGVMPVGKTGPIACTPPVPPLCCPLAFNPAGASATAPSPPWGEQRCRGAQPPLGASQRGLPQPRACCCRSPQLGRHVPQGPCWCLWCGWVGLSQSPFWPCHECDRAQEPPVGTSPMGPSLWGAEMPPT